MFTTLCTALLRWLCGLGFFFEISIVAIFLLQFVTLAVKGMKASMGISVH